MCWGCAQNLLEMPDPWESSFAQKFSRLNIVPKVTDAKFRKCNSWFWKGFILEVNLIHERVEWIVGNAGNISIWECNWIPCKQGLRKPFSSVVNPNLTVKDLWNGERKLNEAFIKNLSNNHNNVDDICKIYIPSHNGWTRRFGLFHSMANLLQN